VEDTELVIYNLKGQMVKTLPFSPTQLPSVSITWDGTDENNQPVSSGIYYYSLSHAGSIYTKKMILLK